MIYIIKRFLKVLLVISHFTPLAMLWVFKSFTFDYISGRIAFRRLPSAAGSMGLKHKKSDYIKAFGKLRGTVKGHEIEVEPFASMNPVIRVRYKNTHKGLEFSLSKPLYRTGKKVVDFKTYDWRFNATFGTKRASKDVAVLLSDNRKLISLINSFYFNWIFRLDSFIIGSDDIFCRLRYGFYFFPYIPAATLKKLIPQLVEIAEEIDSLSD